MNSASEDIKDMLISSALAIGNFAASTGWSIHVGDLPDVTAPDTCIGIFEGPGGPPDPNRSLHSPSVQVRVRGAKGGYQAAYTKAEEIKDGLNGKANETWNGTRYIQITCASDIMYLGMDDKRRPLFTLNFNIQRTA